MVGRCLLNGFNWTHICFDGDFATAKYMAEKKEMRKDMRGWPTFNNNYKKAISILYKNGCSLSLGKNIRRETNPADICTQMKVIYDFLEKNKILFTRKKHRNDADFIEFSDDDFKFLFILYFNMRKLLKFIVNNERNRQRKNKTIPINLHWGEFSTLRKHAKIIQERENQKI